MEGERRVSGSLEGGEKGGCLKVAMILSKNRNNAIPLGLGLGLGGLEGGEEGGVGHLAEEAVLPSGLLY